MSTTANNAHCKIASIQMVSTPDLWENMETAHRLVNSATEDGAQVVVLPEYFCLMGLKDTDKVTAKERFGAGPIQERLAAIAKQNSIHLVAGTIPLEAPEPTKVLNATLVYDTQGHQVARYDKIHLFGFQTATERYEESETITAGNAPGTLAIELDGTAWHFGLSICYDLRFPELYRALGPVDCHIIPAAFTYTTGKDSLPVV